jgi:hypothetical protein
MNRKIGPASHDLSAPNGSTRKSSAYIPALYGEKKLGMSQIQRAARTILAASTVNTSFMDNRLEVEKKIKTSKTMEEKDKTYAFRSLLGALFVVLS